MCGASPAMTRRSRFSRYLALMRKPRPKSLISRVALLGTPFGRPPPGLPFLGGQLLRPADKPDRRVIVGTWSTRADWEAWHRDPQFTETRQRLEGLESAPAEHWWHDVVLDVRKPAAPPPPPTSESPTKRRAKGKTKSPTKALGLTIPLSLLLRANKVIR